MRPKLMSIRHLFALVACVLPLTTRDGAAEAPASDATLQIILGDELAGAPAPAVFVNGQFAGVATGTIQLPATKNQLAVEIGVPQITSTPLYSFVLAPAGLKDGKVSVTYSTFFFTPDSQGWEGSRLFVAPSRVAQVDVKKTTQSGYEMVLGSATYKQLVQFWTTRKLGSHQGLLIDSVPIVSDVSPTKIAYHWKYDTTTNSIRTLEFGELSVWSGGVVPTSATGLPINEEHWVIRSEPAGAIVYTDLGKIGNTVVDDDLPVSSTFFIAVEMKGYVQGRYRNGQTNCQYSRAEGISELTCTLEKVP